MGSKTGQDSGHRELVLSYCIVNTNGREHLLRCLEAIERTHPGGVEAEVIVLDNASEDGSVEAARAWIEDRAGARGEGQGALARNALRSATRLIALDRRSGKAENDSRLLREAGGEYALLLNEDTEVRPGAAAALIEALAGEPGAALAGAQLLSPDGNPQPCAWRLPGIGTAIASALFLHRLFVVQGRSDAVSEVGWAQSAALLVRSDAAEQVGYLDPEFFVYSDETDFAKRLRDAGWSALHVPGAEAVHHEQLASDIEGERRRIVSFHRGRDRYMRKHSLASTAAVVRVLSAWSYLPRALAALFLPGHDPRRYLLHARAALRPWRGEGVQERAEEFNRRRRERSRSS